MSSLNGMQTLPPIPPPPICFSLALTSNLFLLALTLNYYFFDPITFTCSVFIKHFKAKFNPFVPNAPFLHRLVYWEQMGWSKYKFLILQSSGQEIWKVQNQSFSGMLKRSHSKFTVSVNSWRTTAAEFILINL